MTFFGPDLSNGLPLGLASVVGFGRRGFTPASLFAQGAPGAWYDFTDLSTMFQDSAGTTPVTGVEQAVGLILDKSRGATFVARRNLATMSVLTPVTGSAGSEVPNGTGWSNFFATGGTRTYVASSVHAGDSAMDIASVSAARNVIAWTFTAASSTTYTVSFWIESVSGVTGAVAYAEGTLGTGGSSNNISAPSTTGRVQYTFTTGTGAGTVNVRFGIGAAGNESGSIRISGVQVEVGSTASAYQRTTVFPLTWLGTHAIQPTAASRPVLRNRYNLLTWSEDFSNAAWSKANGSVSANSTVAPNGATTADTFIEDTATGTHGFSGTFTSAVQANTVFTTSIYVKRASGTRNVRLTCYAGPDGIRASYNLDTLVVTNGSFGTSTYVSGSIVAVGSGWYQCVLTGSIGTALPIFELALLSGATLSYTGDGTSGIFVWGADLRSANDTAFPYQRITDATTYDSDATKFPLYVEADGVDDAMYTAANLDLSGTDKVTVFAGVTKLSDAARGTVLELSADGATNNGAFVLRAPQSAVGAGDYAWFSRGTALAGLATAASYAAPTTAVLTGLGDIAGDVATLRVNGVQAQTDATDQGTGNFGSYPLYLFARAGTSLFFRGRASQILALGRTASAAEIRSAEQYFAAEMGRAL